MRALLLVLALMLICVASVPVLANGYKPTPAPTEPTMEQVEPIPEVVPTPEQPIGAGPDCTAADEQMLQRTLMHMGLTSQQISQFRAQGLCYSDIAIAQSISARSGCPITQVISQFQTSRDWNQVAKTYNLNLTDIITGPIIVSSDVESYNQMFVSQYYGISQSDVARLRQQGFSWDQINVMANASVRTRQPIQQIADLRTQGMSWSDIAARYNMTATTLTTPMVMRTAYPTTVMGAGPSAVAVVPVMYDTRGNVLLTADQVNTLYKKGYDWMDIAIAANIQMYGGIPIDQTLMLVRQGTLWDTLLTEYGVAPDLAYNVTNYPFERRSIYSSSIDASRFSRIQRYQATCAPTNPCAVPCPAPCPAPTVCPPPAGAGPVCPPAATPAPVCPPAEAPVPACPPGVVPAPTDTTAQPVY